MLKAFWKALATYATKVAIYAADHPDRVTRLALLGPVAPDEATASRYAPVEGRLRSDSAAARFARARAAASDTADLSAECRRWYEAYLPVYVADPPAASTMPAWRWSRPSSGSVKARSASGALLPAASNASPSGP